MDPRQSLSRSSTSNIPQGSYNPNMASAYAMPSAYQNNTHLPPINYPPQLPPASQNYMPQQYRDLPRYNPAPSPVQTPDGRYSGQMTPNTPMSNLPPSSVLPQPHNQNQQQQQQPQQQQNYGGQQQGARPNYPQPLAPAPPRSNMDPFGGGNYGPPNDNRQPAWSGAEQMPGMTGDVGRDPTRTHVVGSQGRRGILPSAPGRPPVMQNGINGSPKGNAIPVKDADGKFPCPNCTKTYLHAKHLKRHMLRHTGDRPYMCVLCNDTFSRSDILKRHFQKCSVRRGNPTGASHLSNPAAHLKKSQAAAAKAAATASPASATTPTSASGMTQGPYTATSMPGSSLPTTSASVPAVGSMPYSMASNGQSDMQHPAQNQQIQNGGEQSNIDPNAANNWQMHNARNNQMMYHSNNGSPAHFGMAGDNSEKQQNVMPNAHHAGDQWNQMPSFGGNEQYMSQMFPGYDQNQNDAKKEYGQHEGGSNGYYIPPTSLGADGNGTLSSHPLWSLDSSLADPLQSKVDRLVDFCFPAGIQVSPQEQNDYHELRSFLTVAAINYFVQLYSNYQGHFPWLHMSTFNLIDAYDGLILSIICGGAVYSDQVEQGQVRRLILRVRSGIERSSRVWRCFAAPASPTPESISANDFEELQAILMCYSLMIWHGGVEERAMARTESLKVMRLVRELNMMILAPQGDSAFSYLHNLGPREQADSSRWDYHSWLEQEKRSRLMFMAFLFDVALNLYFNSPCQFTPAEIKLPLPCDDAAWEASDADSCAMALGLRGEGLQSQTNVAGSLRVKQLEMHHALALLFDSKIHALPRTTNVYSKFILIHALHIEIWHFQKQRSIVSPSNSASAPLPPPDHSVPEIKNIARSLSTALDRWKQAWDEDMQLQYPTSYDSSAVQRRVGFCRDGVHFYWLAKALLHPNRMHDGELRAETRFRHIMIILRKARDWSKSEGARRGEEPGSLADIDDHYETEAPEFDMRKIFKPLVEVYNSPLRG